jgi:hypothetical protein
MVEKLTAKLPHYRDLDCARQDLKSAITSMTMMTAGTADDNNNNNQ